MNVLVTNANSRMALCTVRALAKKGHSVVAADYVPHAMTFFSRFISKKFLYPSPFSAPSDFMRVLKERITQYDIDAIIPIHEETFLMAKHANSLMETTKFAVPNYDALLQVHNKDRLITSLNNLDILTPKTIPLSAIEDYVGLRELFPGKALLKPRQGGGNWGIQILDPDKDFGPQIDKYLGSSHIEKERILLQEWIPIKKKYSHVVVYQRGRLVQDFADIHLRDFPFAGGAGTLRLSCDPGPMTRISQKLFDSLCWHGVAEIEYVTHAETGEFYLIEVNPRIWGGLNSAISSGLDIPDILLKIALDQEIRTTTFTRGIATRWFWGDLRTSPDYMMGSRSKLSVVREYLKLMIDGTKTDEFYWDDPLPFFVWPAHAISKMIRYRSLKPVAYDRLIGEWE